MWTGLRTRSPTCSARRRSSPAPRSASPRGLQSGVSELDPQVEQYLERLKAAGAPPVGELTPEQMRIAFAGTAADLFGPVDPVDVEDRETHEGIPVRIYRPREATDPSPAPVYLHGGGWVLGSLDTHDGIVRALAHRSGCVAVAVDYRLAPEDSFPAGLEDALEATRWALGKVGELGLDPGRIAVGGDSSGATLAAVVAGRAAVALQVLICP